MKVYETFGMEKIKKILMAENFLKPTKDVALMQAGKAIVRWFPEIKAAKGK